MSQPRFWTLLAIVAAAAAARLLPHPPNFTPIAAMALFAGAHFGHRGLAFAVPLGAMLLSDLVLGLGHVESLPFIYGAFALIVALGLTLRNRRGVVRIAGAALAGSVLFFGLTNFGVWLGSGMYPPTLDGLAQSYAAALPFFAHTALGDWFFVGVLFGGYALAQRRLPALREATTV